MAIMTPLFGAVTGDYDEARPGYPPEIVDALRVYHGGAPEPWRRDATGLLVDPSCAPGAPGR
ncbi:hypothetical protein ONA70_14270 [Micromonospora yasonensis]|uniref:hypothetical protein n=1 Tax=Micromonospora yasonensis TaxID=1128667 RepID=UPI002231D48E|nr:hypothetical protein [Micromonospora yasonensis]MCW3841265.1 hypothetical protein [Micromonospora yasonensis]